MKKVGFIGIGIMGKSMVRNLMKAGFEVAVYTRTKEKAEEMCIRDSLIHEGLEYQITFKKYPKDAEYLLRLREKVNCAIDGKNVKKGASNL